jgi:hypothetical protein
MLLLWVGGWLLAGWVAGSRFLRFLDRSMVSRVRIIFENFENFGAEKWQFDEGTEGTCTYRLVLCSLTVEHAFHQYSY